MVFQTCIYKVGFNKHTARKKGLQIDMAVSVIHDEHGEPFLSLFNEVSSKQINKGLCRFLQSYVPQFEKAINQ
jgi:hypothetical protein